MSQQYDSFGGGGYMATSPFSSTGSPSGQRQRSEASQSLRPLTIAQIIKATQAHSDAEWKVDDIEIGQVTVVAQVTSVNLQTGSFTYALDDGTGSIEARHWVTSGNQGKESKWSKIPENSYVRVIGNLRTFGKSRYINANHIRQVKDAHEIFYHVLESISVALIVERGPPNIGGSTTRTKAAIPRDDDTPMTAYAPSTNTAVRDQFAHLPNLPRAIVTFIMEQPQTHAGVDVSTIAVGVGGQAKDARKISEALETLMDQGLVYTTIDDSHFNVSL